MGRRTAEEIKADFKNSMNWYIAAAEAWEAVTIAKKKNGEEFQQLARAIKGAKASYFCKWGTHPQLSINFYNGNKCETDTIDIFYYMDELPKTDTRREEHTTSGYMRKTVYMTPDEIRNKIKERAAAHREHAAEYKKEIERTDSVYNDFSGKFSALMNELKNLCGGSDSSLYYAIRENVRNVW